MFASLLKASAQQLSLLALFCVLFSDEAAQGHNGAVAVAYPVTEIEVDGDISDWPRELPVYQIKQMGSGDEPEDARDFQAQFRIGCNIEESALYVAVEVTDDVTVVHNAAPPDNQDNCVLFVAEKHQPGFSSVQVLNAGSLQSSDSMNRKVVVAETEVGRIYEWRLASQSHIRANHSIGIDVGICDYDLDGSRTLTTWGPGGAAKTNGYALGDALLLDTSAALGDIAGNVKWQRRGMPDATGYPPVVIKSLGLKDLWFRVNCDLSGNYSATLPTGEYEATSVGSIDSRIDATTPVRFSVAEKRRTYVAPISVARSPDPALIGNRSLLFEEFVDARAVDRFLGAYMAHYQIPGISIAIIKNGEIIYRRGLGVKDLASGEAVTETTVFEAASMTKPMFAFAVNRLVDQGTLDLDAPLHKYLPYADIAHDDRYQSITARMILSHTSGFPNWRKGQLELMFDPGTRFSYSGEGYKYLGEVVSHITHKDLEKIFQAEVFDPIGIENARLTWTSDNDPTIAATGHKGNTPLPKRLWSEPWTAASLHIDAHNYAKFLAAVLRREGMSNAAYSEMLRRQSKSQTSTSDAYALGMLVRDTPYGLRYSHGGNNDGFTSQFVVYDENKCGYVFLVNNEQAAALGAALEAFLITGHQRNTSHKLQ